MELSSIRQARATTADGAPLRAEIPAQVAATQIKPTRSGSEYLELRIADAADAQVLRFWADSPAFAAARALKVGDFVAIQAEWTTGQFGLEAGKPSVRPLTAEETATLLGGPPELRQRQAEDFALLEETARGMADPRLRALSVLFLETHGDRLRRTAAARDYHHARRGGLVEHTARMTRSALALAPVYPEINRDLLLAGVLFHDCGKLWENCYETDGFTMPFTMTGELLGHIPVGIELVNRLWHRVAESDAAADWKSLEPSSELVRLHLLHLVGAHHGEFQFGSPVLPRTPEAILLHHIDNIDAKLEMTADSYASSPQLAPGVYERRRPLPARLVRPLAPFAGPPDDPPPTDSDAPDSGS